MGKVLEIFFVGVGLSMDAFAVAVCQGLSRERVTKRQAVIISLLLGGFQSLMPFLGWLLGMRFESYVARMNHWIAFGLLTVIGSEMIKDALGENENKELRACSHSLELMELLALSLATSVDAFAVGVTFAFLDYSIRQAVVIMGITAFGISVLGVYVGNYFGCRYKNKAELGGGIMLIVLGIRILLSHLVLES